MRGFSTIYFVLFTTTTVSAIDRSPWESWGSCDVTCGQGYQIRNRTCTNVAGTTCPPGNTTETRSCFLQGCVLDGGWSDWASWSQCSQSINRKTRTRVCDNPQPSLFGAPCEGVGEQFSTCQGSAGSASASQPILFTAHRPIDHSPKVGSNIVYSKVISNTGHGYDNNTGHFTAPVSGIYSFYVQLCTAVGKHVAIQLTTNDTVLGVMDHSSENFGCASTQAVTDIHIGDVVKVVVTDMTRYGLYETSLRWNMFSGYLLH